MTQVLTQIVEDIKKSNPEKIILFGSHAWGTPNADSDLDFFVIKKSDKPRGERTYQIRQLITNNFTPMDFIVLTPEEIEQRQQIGDLFIQEILQKGKIVYEK